jgi:hypothetical protein
LGCRGAGPLLFGIAECARAREFFRLLHVCASASTPSQRDQALLDMGRVMTIGAYSPPPNPIRPNRSALASAHAVVGTGHMGDSPKYADEHPISDAYLQGLVDKLEADPADPSAQLYAQPGAFNARYTPPPAPTAKSLLAHWAHACRCLCAACPRWTSCSGFCAHMAPSAHPSPARV